MNMMSDYSGFDMENFDTQKSIIEAALSLPSAFDIHTDVGSAGDDDIYLKSNKEHRELKPRTKNHLMHAMYNGYSDAEAAMYVDLCKDRGFEKNIKNEIEVETDFMLIMKEHEKMFLNRYSREKSAYDELKKDCIRLEQLNFKNEFDIVELTRKKESLEKQFVVTRHIQTIYRMFQSWRKCTYWIYTRNRILIEGCDTSGRILTSSERLDYLVDLHELLLDQAYGICRGLMSDLKQSVWRCVYTEPLLHPNNLLQNVAMTLMCVPEYLRKKRRMYNHSV